MSGPRKGLYDDRPIEHEYCGEAGCPSAPHLFNERMAVAEATVEAAKATKKEKEAYEKDLKKRTAKEFNLRSKNMAPVIPIGPYPENSEAEMLVRAQDSQRAAVPAKPHLELDTEPLSTLGMYESTEEKIKNTIRGNLTRELIELTEKLKESAIDELFDYRPMKVVLDKLKALELDKDISGARYLGWDLTEEAEELKPKDRNEAQTRFGRVYYGTGETIPPHLTKEEWEKLKNEVKDEHVDDPAPGPNDGLSDNDLYEEMKAEEALENKATSEEDWYRKAGVEEEVKSAEGFQAFLADRLRGKDGPGIQPDKPWPRVEEADRPDTYPQGHARYVAQQVKIKAEQKKERWNKVLTFFCKAIVLSVGIFYGIIIMEHILDGKPIATFLNRILMGE